METDANKNLTLTELRTLVLNVVVDHPSTIPYEKSGPKSTLLLALEEAEQGETSSAADTAEYALGFASPADKPEYEKSLAAFVRYAQDNPDSEPEQQERAAYCAMPSL